MASKGGKLASARPDKVPSSKLDKIIPKSASGISTTEFYLNIQSEKIFK